MEQPRRIQLRRTKGWRMPPDTVSVARGPGRKWGNPFTIPGAIEAGYAHGPGDGARFVVDCFRDWIGEGQRGRDCWQGQESDVRRRPFVEDIGELRGKNLACWCTLDAPCHADVLLEMANAPPHAGEEELNTSPSPSSENAGKLT